MNLKINEQWKGQKFDLQQVAFCPQFFSIEDPIDFNRLASIADICEQCVYDTKKPTLTKITNVGTIKEFKIIEETIRSLLLVNPNLRIDTDIFASLNKHGISDTHDDIESVFLIPTYGLVNYNIYQNQKVLKNFQMSAGDLLVIPKHIIHSAIPLSSRIVVSVGVYN